MIKLQKAIQTKKLQISLIFTCKVPKKLSEKLGLGLRFKFNM